MTRHVVPQILTRLFGSDFRHTSGIVHCTSVFESPKGVFNTIEIDEFSPKCAFDFFALNAFRAFTDVMLYSGKLLRDEPCLSSAIQGPFSGVLCEWRKEVLRKPNPMLALICTRRPLDFLHVFFAGDVKVRVCCDPLILPTLLSNAKTTGRELRRVESSFGEVERWLARSQGFQDIEIVSLVNSTVEDVLAYSSSLAGRQGACGIEAGPSITRRLYFQPSSFTPRTLLVSVYRPPSPVKQPLSVGVSFTQSDLDDAGFILKHSSSTLQSLFSGKALFCTNRDCSCVAEGRDWEFRLYER